MNVQYYRGERVCFRPLEIEDEPLCRQWINDPENWRTLDFCWPVNAMREREYIEKQYASKQDVSLGIAVSETDRLIGVCGLHGIDSIHRRAVFGLLIGDRAHQSSGFGTAATQLMLQLAFEEYNLNRIELTVFENNPRAIRAYERAGFVPEGRQRQAYFRGGKYIDVLRYGLLRKEWQDKRSAESGEMNVHDDGPVVISALAV